MSCLIAKSGMTPRPTARKAAACTAWVVSTVSAAWDRSRTCSCPGFRKRPGQGVAQHGIGNERQLEQLFGAGHMGQPVRKDRRSDHDLLEAADAPGLQTGIAEPTDADGQVQIALHQIERLIVQASLCAAIRVAGKKVGDGRNGHAIAVVVRRRDPQCAARSRSVLSNFSVSILGFAQDLRRPLVKRAPGRGRFDPPCASHEQPRPHFLFETGNLATDQALVDPKPVGRLCEAAVIDDGDEIGQAIKVARFAHTRGHSLEEASTVPTNRIEPPPRGWTAAILPIRLGGFSEKEMQSKPGGEERSSPTAPEWT